MVLLNHANISSNSCKIFCFLSVLRKFFKRVLASNLFQKKIKISVRKLAALFREVALVTISVTVQPPCVMTSTNSARVNHLKPAQP